MHSTTTTQSGASLSMPRFAVLASALPLALLLGAPLAPAEAATLSVSDHSSALASPSPGSSPERAAELEARAREMMALVDRQKDAARLFREAADLREDGDPLKVESLRNASRSNFYAGRTNRALSDAAEAARLALRQGDVVAAAHVHVDAAWIALELGDNSTAAQHAEDARMLAASPLLTRAQRMDLMIRLAEPV
ncbi:MAG: hypothetical protein EA350_09980 [Gemmatimonadales bacterium]|nr:MAG: hypothetical protein EA350_09980 [Gemmatimonadales bacterium]